MKFQSRFPFPSFVSVLCLALNLSLLAQEPPSSAEKPVPSAPAASPADAARAADVPAAAAAPATPDVEQPAATEPTRRKGGLRRIDTPDTNEPAPKAQTRRGRTHRASDDVPFGNHLVPRDSVIDEAVAIMGTNTVEGEVRRDAVSVLGATTIGPEGKVGGAAVAVLGPLTSQGDIRRDAVSVLGGVDIDGHVGGEVVSVLGDLHLGPKAEIDGNVVLAGGTLTKDPGAVVHGNEIHVPIAGGFENFDKLSTWVKRCLFLGRPLAFGRGLGWAWAVALSFLAFYVVLAALFGRAINRCVETLETRPGSSILAAVLTVLLSPVAILLLIVTVVGLLLVPFIGAGLFFAGLFGKAVMLAWIGRRFTKLSGSDAVNHPALAVLIGGVIVLALYTIWGSFILYKLLTWLGLGVVVYTIALSLKRETPAVAAASAGGPRAMPPPPPPASVAPSMARTSVAAPSVAAPPPMVSPGFSEPPPATTESLAGAVNPDVPMSSPGFGTPPAPVSPPEGVAPPTYPSVAAPESTAPGFVPPPLSSLPPPPASSVPPAPPVRPMPAAMPVVVSSDTLMRAGFFIRLAAMLLDALLISLSLGFTSSMMPRFLHFSWFPSGLLLVLAIYAAVMWQKKGTTIGGIICGLKVVRLDDREIDWTTAIVRALSCFLSLFAAGLGFIWVAFDDGKQSWHDKIAGTTVVRVPKGVALL